MDQIKLRLHAICLEYVQERIANAESAILNAREAANDDTKSSAGDKYETSREMMQQEIDRNQKQLEESRRLKMQLEAIVPERSPEQVEPGSLVHTSLGIFYISISKGQIPLDGKIYFAISPASPLGQVLMRKRKGEEMSFNGKVLRILELK